MAKFMKLRPGFEKERLKSKATELSGHEPGVIHPTPEDLEHLTYREVIPGLWDVGNSNSIYEMLEPHLAEKFIAARISAPDLFDLGEQELRKRLKTELGKYPSVTENQLRLRFWLEHDMVAAEGTGRIQGQNIFRGVCTAEVFHQYLDKPAGAAWISCMPLTHELHLMELLNFGAHRMRNIMRHDPFENGKFNSKLAELQAKLYHAAELRVYGAIPQTVRNLNVNVSDTKAVREAVESRGTVLLEDKVAEMEKAARKNALIVKDDDAPDSEDLKTE